MSLCKQCGEEKALMKNRRVCIDCNRTNQRELWRKRNKKAGTERKAPVIDPALGDFLLKKWVGEDAFNA